MAVPLNCMALPLPSGIPEVHIIKTVYKSSIRHVK